jgi:tetratricopeptide (TPR) repeat protein
LIAYGELEERNPEYFLLLGNCYLMENEPDLAAKHFGNAIKVAGDEKAEILYQVGSSYIPYGNIAKAVGFFERSFAENPENEFLLNDLGFFCDQLGSPDKSIYYYNLYLAITGVRCLKKP